MTSSLAALNPLAYQELYTLLRQKSFKTGNFTLASGKKSSWYLDCRVTALSGRGSYLIGQLLYVLLQNQPKTQPIDSVGGMVLGAAPLVTAVTSYSAQQGQPLEGFLVRKEAKNYGGGKQIEGNLHPWMRVVLLEDVVTTGGSTQRAIEAIQTSYPSVQIAGVLALVDRNAGGAETFSRLGIPYQALYSVQAFLQECASASPGPGLE